MPIEELNVTNNTVVQNTQVETTNVLFNAEDGGTIDVGGNVNALSQQQAQIEPAHHALLA